MEDKAHLPWEIEYKELDEYPPLGMFEGTLESRFHHANITDLFFEQSISKW